MLFIILGDIKVMGVEGLFRLQHSNYTQRREYHSIQNQLVGGNLLWIQITSF